MSTLLLYRVFFPINKFSQTKQINGIIGWVNLNNGQYNNFLPFFLVLNEYYFYLVD